MRLILLGMAAGLLSAATVAAQDADGQASDPTRPSRAIAERMRQPEMRAANVTSVQLPQFPKIKLRAIVLREPNHGVAWLDVDGESVRIELHREMVAPSKSIAVPAGQFAPYIAAGHGPIGEGEDAEEPPVDVMDPRSTFAWQGRWYSVEMFNSSMVVLRARPEGSLIPVR